MRADGFVDSGPVSQLLRCLSDNPDSTTDWERVVVTAANHRLAPLLFKRLKKAGARDRVPADAWERLRLAYLDNAGRNMHLYRELQAVLRRLRGEGIPVVVLKGAFLAEAVYGDIALRPMGDVDLMVPKSELLKVQAILLDMGGSHEQAEDVEQRCLRRGHMPPCRIRDLAVEVHWTIVTPTGPVKVDAAGVRDRARPATIAGVEVLALSLEDLLLHTCLHFSYQHRHEGLKSFCDIAHTVRRFGPEINWEQVARLAREWGAARYVALALSLAGSMLGAKVPDGALERLVPGGIDQPILDAARESIITQTDYRRWLPPFERWEARSVGDKVRLAWRAVFLSRDQMAALYPGSRNAKHLWPYYALRFRDGARTLGSRRSRHGSPSTPGRGSDGRASLAHWFEDRNSG